MGVFLAILTFHLSCGHEQDLFQRHHGMQAVLLLIMTTLHACFTLCVGFTCSPFPLLYHSISYSPPLGSVVLGDLQCNETHRKSHVSALTNNLYLELLKRLFQTSLSCTLSNCDKASVWLCEMQVKPACGYVRCK